METKDNYTPHFSRAFEEAVEEMAGFSCRAGDSESQPETLVSAGMVVIIGITGARQGRFILDISRETARKVSEIINDETYDLDDQFIIYTMAELANIVSGRAITTVNNNSKGLGLRLTPPGIFFGDKLFIDSPKISAQIVSVSTPAGEFRLSIGFGGGK